jgi:uncharacterized membrane protein
MARIYYVGDWAVLTGPWFAETPFQNAMKGLDVFNYGRWLKEALESTGRHEVTSVPAWEFYKLGPGDYERMLEQHDVVIFSDVEGKLFQLAPSFFDRAKFGTGVLTFPDRVRLTIEAVRGGKGLVLLGGWYSFTGEIGKGGWGRTPLREVMPVTCLDHEDLVESTEGYHPVATEAGRAAFADIDLSDCPPLLGYNQVRLKPGCEPLLSIAETGDPLLVTRREGRGTVLCYTSDPAPHWGCNLVFWPRYAEFWLRCLDLVLTSMER